MPKSQKIGKSICVIPDCQVKPGVDISHLTWIGNYIVEKQVDIVINLGDFADLPSLSSYDVGKLAAEGKRYSEDTKFTKHAMGQLLGPIHKHNKNRKNKYNPRRVLTLGNHEEGRINKIIQENPKLEGTISVKDLGYEEAGWEVIPFLQPINVEGIDFCHYFVSGAMGRPVSSAAALLRARQRSAIMGHVQFRDISIHPFTGNIGMFAGICYTHHEDYLNPQGNSNRPQIVMLHEVMGDGKFDPMLVSLEFLKKNYS